MFEIGRIAVKLAGRDSGMKCVIIDVIDKNNVMIDGQVRRRKCNIKHLELLDQVIKISKNAPKSEVIKIFKKEFNIEIKETKPKKTSERPKKQRVKKEMPIKKEVKKVPKKAVKTETKVTEAKVEKKVETKPKAEVKEAVKVKKIKPKEENNSKTIEFDSKKASEIKKID